MVNALVTEFEIFSDPLKFWEFFIAFKTHSKNFTPLLKYPPSRDPIEKMTFISVGQLDISQSGSV